MSKHGSRRRQLPQRTEHQQLTQRGVQQTQGHADYLEATASVTTVPMPDPQTLREYEQLLPGCADRLLVMAEKAQNHEIQLDLLAQEQARQELLQEAAAFKRGQICAIIVSFFALASGTTLGIMGEQIAQQVVAGIFGASGLGGIVAAFLSQRQSPNAAKEQAGVHEPSQ